MSNLFKTAIIGVVLLTVPSLVFAAKTHLVKKNETIYAVARKYHVTVKELKAANNLVNNHIKSGDLLVIPLEMAATGEDAVKTGKTKQVTYRVLEGETLLAIARKNNISAKELKRLNGLRDDLVKPGQILVVKGNKPAEGARQRVVGRQLRNADLFSEEEYERSLAELTEPDLDKKTELPQNGDLKVEKITELRKSAYSFLGIRYRFGGETRRGIDCSSFVQQVFRELSVELPRTAREQYKVGTDVPPENLQKGDLIFFRTYARFPSHVGIYLGDNKMIHASSGSRKVIISSMNTPYYRARYIGAKRIDKVNPAMARLDDLVAGVKEEQVEALESDAPGAIGSN